MVMNDSFLDSVVATMRVEKIKVMDFLNMSRFHGILMMLDQRRLFSLEFCYEQAEP